MTDYKHMFLVQTTHGLVVRCYRKPMPKIDHTMTEAWFKRFAIPDWLKEFDEVNVADQDLMKFKRMALNSSEEYGILNFTKQADKIFEEGIEIDMSRVNFVCIHCQMTLENHGVYVGCQKHKSPTYLAYLSPKPIT